MATTITTTLTSTTTSSTVLSRAALSPPPLLIRKQPRRTKFRRRRLSKSSTSQNSDQYVFGPLDDIIDEINCEIWNSPLDYNFDSSALDLAGQLKTPSFWTVTPLPLSRIPSDHPLTIRKNRISRSSTSGSSAGATMTDSSYGSQEGALTGGPVDYCNNTNGTPWPLLGTATSHGFEPSTNRSASASGIQHPTAQQALETIIQNNGVGRPDATRRRPSRLRRFTNGFPRLRRMGTDDANGSSGDTSDLMTLTAGGSLTAYDEHHSEPDGEDPSDEAVEAYIRKNARNGTKFGSLMGRMAKRLPPPTEYEHEPTDKQILGKPSMLPTTLRAAVNIFTEKKVLSEEVQEFDIVVEIEGVLHNRRPLPDSTIDVIFVVDNGYYVTKACLGKALDAVNGALYHLDRGDRLALYTTHCTHHTVTGNRPDLHYPLRPLCADTEETFRELTTRIAQGGTQAWEPPRPNPSMTEVLLGVARSLQDKDLKRGRTHVILLSPAIYVLHDVSRFFPDLYIHRINAATLPYCRRPELQDTICNEDCCRNVFVSNWSVYQSVPSRLKRVIKHARSERPAGELTDLSIDIRTREGCEIVRHYGKKDIPCLYLGQIHVYFARIRVTREHTQGVDLESRNPILNSSLDVKTLRQELLNSVAVGAIKTHLFDVQVFYRSSLHTTDCWNYTETPFLVIRELGGLALPVNSAIEVYKRLYFYQLKGVTAEEANIQAQSLLRDFGDYDEQARSLLERMIKEIDCHQSIQAYEDKYRQKLPLCPGPIELESSAHEWLVDLWNRKKSKRKGVAVVKDEEITGLIQGMDGLERWK